MSNAPDPNAALERLLAGEATRLDQQVLTTTLTAGQYVVGDGNVTAGGDIVGSNIIQVASREAMNAVLGRLYPQRIDTLPMPPADFTGRAAQLERIEEAIFQAPVVISSIRGLGGIGKTALALEVAQRLAPRYPDASLYLNLRDGSGAPLSIQEAKSQVVHAFDPAASIPSDDRELGDLYLQTLAGKIGLLVLDDASAVEQASPLLPPSGWTTIVTSRRHFALPGAGDPINLDAMTESDARLFLRRIAARLSDAEADEIAGLCGRLPLALRLAGSFLQNRPAYLVADYIRRLADEAQRIERLDAAVPFVPEQLGIDATLLVSYEILTPELQRRFRELAVFDGEFDVRAAAAVWAMGPEADDPSADDWQIVLDQADDILGALGDISLIDSERVGRYRLHDLVRLFGRGRMTGGERDAVDARHAFHYGSRLLAAADRFSSDTGGMLSGLALVDADWTDIRKGQAWAVSRGQEDDATAPLTIDYAVRPSDILTLRLHPREQIAWLEAALATARRLDDPGAECSALGNLGAAYFALGDADQALDYYQQSLDRSREMGSQSAEAGALVNLGNANLILGETSTAIDYFQQARPIMVGLGNRHGEVVVISGLGQAAINLGDAATAITRYGEALSITRGTGNERDLANTLGNLGNTLIWISEYEQAMPLLEQALPFFTRIGDRDGTASTLNGIGNVLNNRGEFEEAKVRFNSALAIARQIGDKRGEGISIGGLGSACLGVGDFSGAVDLFSAVASIARETRDRRTEMVAYANLGKAHSGLRDWPQAIRFHRRALAVAGEIQDVRSQGTMLASLANTLGKSGDFSAAIEAAEAALRILIPLQDLDIGRIQRQLWRWRLIVDSQNPPAQASDEPSA